MIQIALTVGLASGTVKSRIAVIVISGAETSSQGRALPSFVLVRSMIWPMTTLVTASMTLETMGKIVRNMPPHMGVRFRTSV